MRPQRNQICIFRGSIKYYYASKLHYVNTTRKQIPVDLILQHTMTEAERVLNVIEAIKKEGLKGVGNFILLALSLEDSRVKSHISPIYQSKGKALQILEILLSSCLERRHTDKYVNTLREKIGGAIKKLFEDLVDFELKDVMQDKDVHRLPSSLNTDVASGFEFTKIQKVFKDKAPFT